LAHNVGKGEAVRRGVLRAMEGGADVVGFWDADLSAPLVEVDALKDALARNAALQAVFGSRVKMVGRTIERTAARHYAGRLFATVADACLDLPFYDTQCGAKLFRAGPCARAVFATPFLSRWVFDLEIGLRIRRWGKPEGAGLDALVREVPLEIWRHHGDTRLSLWDGPRALLDIARIRAAYF
jgi:hypothetical protein